MTVAVNEDFDVAFLNNEHACARIPLPKDYVTVAVLFPQPGHADALTCIYFGSQFCAEYVHQGQFGDVPSWKELLPSIRSCQRENMNLECVGRSHVLLAVWPVNRQQCSWGHK